MAGRASRGLTALLCCAALAAAACGGSESTLRRTVAGKSVPAGQVAATDAGVGTVGDSGSSPVEAAAGARPGRTVSGGAPAIAAQRGATARDSDRGVTSDRIRLGVITTLSGGQRFVGEPPYRMAQAYAEDVNRRGGINGRKLEIIGYDVCISCPEDGLAQAKKAVEQDGVFAILNGFVANASLGPAMAYLSSKQTPMIQTAGSTTVNPYGFAFGLNTPQRGAIDADFVNRYLEEHKLPKRVALLRFAQPLDEEIQRWQKKGLQKLGIEIVDEEAVEYGAPMTNQGSQVSKMRSANPSMVVGSHGVVCAFNMQSAAQQSWNVPYFCTIMYDQFSLELAGDAVKGRDVFADTDGYATQDVNAPGVADYTRVLRTYYPSGDVGLITLYSFLGMKVFEDAVAPMGDAVTREGLLRFLSTLRDYDAGGLVPPFTVTPEDHTAIEGTHVVQLADGKWKRVTPAWVYPSATHGIAARARR